MAAEAQCVLWRQGRDEFSAQNKPTQVQQIRGGNRFQENVRTQTEAGEGSDQNQPAAAGVSSQSP